MEQMIKSNTKRHGNNMSEIIEKSKFELFIWRVKHIFCRHEVVRVYAARIEGNKKYSMMYCLKCGHVLKSKLLTYTNK